MSEPIDPTHKYALYSSIKWAVETLEYMHRNPWLTPEDRGNLTCAILFVERVKKSNFPKWAKESRKLKLVKESE